MMSPLAYADAGLSVHPRGFGEKSYAAWNTKEGLVDSRGTAKHALYFQKMTATEIVAAGIAEIVGVEGAPVSHLEGLERQRRNGGRR